MSDKPEEQPEEEIISSLEASSCYIQQAIELFDSIPRELWITTLNSLYQYVAKELDPIWKSAGNLMKNIRSKRFPRPKPYPSQERRERVNRRLLMRFPKEDRAMVKRINHIDEYIWRQGEDIDQLLQKKNANES